VRLAGKKGDTPLVLGVVLVALPIAIYAQVASFGFVGFDDPGYVSENARVLAGLNGDNVVWAFTTGAASNWHPLTWLSLMLDADIGGGSPRTFHITNLVLHVLNGLLLFLAFDRMTGRSLPSAVVAAWFAVHPLHVESVAWIAERKDVLSTTFGLLALLTWIAHVKDGRPAAKWWSLAAYAASLMAKPMLVSFPILLLLLDVWPLTRTSPWRRRVIEKLPFAVLAVASCVITVVVQAQGGATRSMVQFPLLTRAANAAATYVAYLADTFWPSGLAVFYPYAYGGRSPWLVFAAVAGLAAVTWACWRLRARAPYTIVGWLWYLVMLVPVVGFVQVGSQARADRYTYLPLVGIFVVAAWALAESRRKFALPAVAVATVAVLAVLAHRQAATWRDSETLFRHALAVTQENAPAHNLLAGTLLQRGHLDEGIEQAEAAVAIAPSMIDAQTNLIRALIAKGRIEDATSRAGVLAVAHPDDSRAQVNQGLIAIVTGRADDALRHLREAIRLDPADAEAHLNLGAVLRRQGKTAEARAEFQEAARLKPRDPRPRQALAHLND
jgi:protein O-mannosyl-transferase